MVMCQDFVVELLFFDVDCLGKEPGSKIEVAVRVV